MYKLKKMKNLLNTIEEVTDILTTKIFVSKIKESYVFDVDAYVIMRGDLRLLIGRNNVALESINPKHKYTIFQYESTFIFRTYENDIFPGENEFIISIRLQQKRRIFCDFQFPGR